MIISKIVTLFIMVTVEAICITSVIVPVETWFWLWPPECNILPAYWFTMLTTI
jgi:hypothetical protein